MSSTTKNKRISRVLRRGTPELVDALRRGLISARTADTLFYMQAQEQRAQLERRLAAARERQRRSQLVAQTIRRYLDSAERIDLSELQRRIQSALVQGFPIFP
jgi:hypothetical protein